MGFAVYRGGDWNASEFNTGKADMFASLANIPRQFLEAAQMRKENELKERETANREQSRKDEASFRSQSLEKDQQQIDLQKGKFAEDKERWDADQPMRAAELAAKKADTVAQQAHTAALNQQIASSLGLEDRQSMARQLQAKKENSDMALQAVFINKGADVFTDPAAQAEWVSALSNKMVAESAEMRGMIMGQIEQKYKKVPNLINYDFLNSYNTAVKQRNLDEAAFTQFIHNKPGQPLSPDFKSPNAMPVFTQRQMQQEAIWNSIQKVPDSDPRLAAFLKTFPQYAGDQMVKARLANILTGQKNNLLFDKNEDASLRTKLKQAIAMAEKEKKDKEASFKRLTSPTSSPWGMR
jgi:hypothetical protein